MARPRKRKWSNVNCSYCNKSIGERPNNRKNHFCSHKHYSLWMKNNSELSKSRRKYTDEELLDELKRISQIVNKIPSYEDVKKYVQVGSPRTFQRQLGPTWENVKRHLGWKPDYETFIPMNVSPEDGMWLAGIIDGEGCFRTQRPSPSNKNKNITSYSMTFCISLRADDKKTLDEVCRILGTKSKLYLDNRNCPSDTKNANPAWKYFLRDIPTLAYHLIPLLEKYPLRSKKIDDFIIFKIGVNILLNKWQEGRKNKKYTNKERDILDKVYHALHDIKAYNITLNDVIQKYNLSID